MKQDTDLELAKRILRSLGFKLVSSIETGFTGVGGIPWYGINLDNKQEKDIYVYADGRDGKVYAIFDSVEELLAGILYTKRFLVARPGEFPKIKDNPFSGMTKEEVAIKLDLESQTMFLDIMVCQSEASQWNGCEQLHLLSELCHRL